MATIDRARLDSPGSAFLRMFRAPEWGLITGIIAIVGVIYFSESEHAFFQSYSLQTLMHRVSLFGVLAVGAAVVIIAGGIDLSTGAVVALSSVVSAKLITGWLRGGTIGEPPSPSLILAAIGITLLLGLGIGLLHAVLINQLRLPPFIATLATMAGLRSVASLICQNRTINVSFDWYRVWGSKPWYTLSLFAVIATTVSIIMGCTVVGRHLFALGGNETAARLSGLRTKRLKAVAYGLSGVLSAAGGILFTGLSGQADSRLGVSYELIAITAAVVGGCSLSGGVGSIRGTVLGLVLTQVVIKATGLRNWGIDSTQIEGLVLGTVVVVAVAFNQRFRRVRD
jgi:ribose/xylose/arabinose/galactoside ABC-type transport system permease subunit